VAIFYGEEVAFINDIYDKVGCFVTMVGGGITKSVDLLEGA